MAKTVAAKVKEARILPHSIEAEQCVLGCVFINEDASFSILSTLKDKDFYSEPHKIIFEAMTKLYANNVPIDYVTLTEVLEKNDMLDSVGGVDYLMSLTTILPSASNYTHYMNIVKNNSVLRELIAAGQDIINKSFEDIDKDEALTFAEQNIFAIGEKDSRGGFAHINEAVTNAISRFEDLQNTKGVVKGVPSGIYALDKITNGFQKGALILIAARPGCGKTSLGMNIINHAAVKAGKKCALFSLEMSKEEIASRSICSLAYVDMGKALKGEMNEKEWKAVLSASKKLSDSNIYIDEGFAKSPMDILSKCRKLKRERGLDCLMIDYLQLMQGSDKARENRTLEIGEITRTLKMAARELEIPILLLSQLSRQSEGRKDHRPILSDLRESGSIEQDADMVLFIYRPDMYNDVPEAEKNSGLAEIIIAKNRSGKCENIKVKWVGSITSFLNLDRDANAQSLEETEPVEYNKPQNNAPNNAPIEDVPPPDIPPVDMSDVPFDMGEDAPKDAMQANNDNAMQNTENTPVVEDNLDTSNDEHKTANNDTPEAASVETAAPIEAPDSEEMKIIPLAEAEELLDIFDE